jgi:hypothetical protein
MEGTMISLAKTGRTKRICKAAVFAGAAVWTGFHAAGQQSLDQILRQGVVAVGDKKPSAAGSAQQQTNPPRGAAGASRAGDGSAGFRMELPRGWTARLGQNGAVLATNQDNSAVVIAPVSGAGTAAAQWLREAGAASLRQYLNSPVLTGIYPSRMGPGAALGSFEFGEGAGMANVLSLFNGEVGTLYVIAAPKGVFFHQRPALVRILRSFSFTGESPAGMDASFTRFRDPNEGAFTIDVPAGWKAEGGLVRKSTLDTRPFVWAASPDGSTVIHLRDPAFGTFVIPDQMLMSTVIREGMTYTPGYGNIMVVWRYQPGPQFAQQYAAKLAADTQATNLQIKSVNAREDLSKPQTIGIMQEQTTGGEVEFTCTRNGRECAGKVLAATKIQASSAMPGSALWWVDLLASFVTQREQYSAVERIFEHMIASTQWNPQWVAMQNQTAYNTGQIARDASEYTSQVIEDVSRNRDRSRERIHQNRIDAIRGVVRLRDPNTGEELEGVAGRNYYYRAPGGRPVGTDIEVRSPDFTELEQIR